MRIALNRAAKIEFTNFYSNAGTFVHTIGDAHLYTNHLEQSNLQLSRTPIEPLPTLKLNPEIKNIDDFSYEDIEVIGYEHHPHIKAPIAV